MILHEDVHGVIEPIDEVGSDFRLAYDSYRRAYQELAKSPVTARIQKGPEAGTYALSWPSDPGGIYSAAYSTNLVDWDAVHARIVGEAEGTNVVTNTPPGASGFYRVFRLSSYEG